MQLRMYRAFPAHIHSGQLQQCRLQQKELQLRSRLRQWSTAPPRRYLLALHHHRERTDACGAPTHKLRGGSLHAQPRANIGPPVQHCLVPNRYAFRLLKLVPQDPARSVS